MERCGELVISGVATLEVAEIAPLGRTSDAGTLKRSTAIASGDGLEVDMPLPVLLAGAAAGVAS